MLRGNLWLDLVLVALCFLLLPLRTWVVFWQSLGIVFLIVRQLVVPSSKDFDDSEWEDPWALSLQNLRFLFLDLNPISGMELMSFARVFPISSVEISNELRAPISCVEISDLK